MKSIIFVILHKPVKVLENSILKPIFVNAENNPNKSYKFTDNNGTDTISNKNSDYCELTAMYWAWKNLDKNYQYVGFFHYRRYLSFKENFFSKYFTKFIVSCPSKMDRMYGLSADYIQNYIKDYDIILPKKHLIYDHNLGKIKQFKYVEYINSKNPRKLFNIMAKIIINKYPHMEKSALQVFNSHRAYFKNMFIMKRECFNEYMDFAFTNLFAIEEECKKSKIELVEREIGFLAEYLVNIYIAYKLESDSNLKIKELPILRKLNLSLSVKVLIKIKERMKVSYIKNFFRK